jgi:hypothetical protein
MSAAVAGTIPGLNGELHHYYRLDPVGLRVGNFKTGRAGQPPAWKVRFLRRVVAGRADFGRRF